MKQEATTLVTSVDVPVVMTFAAFQTADFFITQNVTIHSLVR